MSKKFRDLVPGIMLLAAMIFAATIFPMAVANGQAVTLQEQLAAQYKLVKMGSDTSGYSVVEEGTLLAVQKGGLLGVPYSDTSVQNNKYEGGVVKASVIKLRSARCYHLMAPRDRDAKGAAGIVQTCITATYF